jgi:hypothetical protein
VMELISGMTAGPILGAGKITVCMGKASIFGRTGRFTLVVTLKIKDMGLGFTHGLMVVGMRETGTWESSMGKQITSSREKPLSVAFGTTEELKDGRSQWKKVVMPMKKVEVFKIDSFDLTNT